jgi:hypothetical protein
MEQVHEGTSGIIVRGVVESAPEEWGMGPKAVLENDGEVAVLLPLSKNCLSFDYPRACVYRRAGMTREEFQKQYGIMDEAAEVKARMLGVLGITEKAMNEALQRARSESLKRQSLLKLVHACRKKHTSKN